MMCLVGNKSDLSDNREVSTEDAMEYASSIGALFCETSALKNTGKIWHNKLRHITVYLIGPTIRLDV